MQWELKWCRRMWVWENMVPKHKLLESIPQHEQGLNYGASIYELDDHVGENGLNLNWLTKLMFAKKTLLASFPSCLLKKPWVKSAFPYALLPRHKGPKWDTIGVIRGASAKLPHYMGPTLVYIMENKMSLVHHIVEWRGCGYINEDGKGLNERIQGHPMLKPKSELMQVEWE